MTYVSPEGPKTYATLFIDGVRVDTRRYALRSRRAVLLEASRDWNVTSENSQIIRIEHFQLIAKRDGGPVVISLSIPMPLKEDIHYKGEPNG